MDAKRRCISASYFIIAASIGCMLANDLTTAHRVTLFSGARRQPLGVYLPRPLFVT